MLLGLLSLPRVYDMRVDERARERVTRARA